MPDPPPEIEPGDPRTQALAAAAAVVAQVQPPVEFHSQGRLLILGAGEVATRAARHLEGSLSCHLLTDRETPAPNGVIAHDRRGRRVSVDGHLGAFTVVLEDPPDHLDLGRSVDPERPVFDLVLDLGREPALGREWGPPGYFAVDDEADLARALVELPKLVGRREKPKYFQLDAMICAHGLPGTEGCRRCIDVCPAEAVASVEGKIEVNPNLCQGGGACATTCPTGAFTYAHPRRADTLERLRRLLTTFRASAGGERPVLVILERRTELGSLDRWPQRVLPLDVEEVGSLGMESWLSALALGAGAVRILRGPHLPASVAHALEEQLGFARAILAGLGFPEDALGWTTLEGDPLVGAELPTLPPLSAIHAQSKRGVLYAALDHLRANAPCTADLLTVPAGAPFGQVHVDAKTCTTCMSCAFVCPARALSPGGNELPELRFIEAACVQCGLCEVACPEHAITLEARLLLPEAERLATRVLHRDEPFACVRCGKPFASAGTVRAVIEKLADHPMFTTSGIEVLKTCDACRLGDLS